MFHWHASEYYGLFLHFKVRALAAFAPETGACVCSGQQRIDRSAAPIKISPIKNFSNESKMRPSAII
jgi:hypothetical protein